MGSALIKLSSTPDVKIYCSTCKVNIESEQFFITGIHNVVYGKCPSCYKGYFKQMPVNAGLFYPGIIEENSGIRSDTLPYDNWFLKGFVKAFAERKKDKVTVTVEKNRPLQKKKVAILNCIDHCYGHCLFELFNASWYMKQPDVDLIILVQKNLRWLVPDGAAEVWVADISFGNAHHWYDDLAKQVHDFTKDIPELYICQSFVQTDDTDYAIEDYSGIKPFPLDEWNQRLAKPTVTFIWRTDRFWRKILPAVIDNRITNKLFPSILNSIRSHYHLKWIFRFADVLKRQVPQLDFAIAGMDSKKNKLPSWIKDLRFEKHTDEDAINNCKRYADSHLVIGCNGSSLILPSAHAGACIDIVPGDMWAVSAGSFSFRTTSIGDTHFRYVLLPPEITVKRLVAVAVSVLRDRALIELHTSNPWRDHDSTMPREAWSDYRLASFRLGQHFNDESGLITTNK